MRTARRLPDLWAISAFLCAATVAASACGGTESPDGDSADGDVSSAMSGGLTEEQLENGVGPISEIELGAIDESLVETGRETFTIKCSACHKLDERYVGPPLRDVTERRAPAFIMNMILDPEGMLAQHPEVQALLAQYAVPMANQNLTEDEARAVLEYLRSEGSLAPGS